MNSQQARNRWIVKLCKEIGKLIQMDEISIDCFIGPFIASSYFPSPYRPPWIIETELVSENTSKQSIKSAISFFLIRKWLRINESVKWWLSRKEIKTDERPVLILAPSTLIHKVNGKSMLEIFDEIANYLDRRGIYPLVMVYDPISKNSLLRIRDYVTTPYNYLNQTIIKRAATLAESVHRKWDSLEEKRKIELFASGNEKLWLLLKPNLDFLFSKDVLFFLCTYYLVFKRVLLLHNVRVVYLTSLVGIYEVPLACAALKLGRKIVYTPHGYTTGLSKELEFTKNVIITASGETEKRNFIKSGIKKNQLIVTGSPFYDGTIRHRGKISRPKFRKRKVILLITTSLVESQIIRKKKYFALIREVLREIKKVKTKADLVIKLHPQEKFKKEYKKILKSLNLNATIIQHGSKKDLYSIIRKADVVMGFGSTVLVECMMLGKNVIHLDMFLPQPQTCHFRRGALCVGEIRGLNRIIYELLFNETLIRRINRKRRVYLRRAYYRNDGNAYQRVGNVIMSLLGRRR